MNCERHEQGRQVLSAILADLNESQIRLWIDEPIEAAFQSLLERLEGRATLPGAGEVFAQFVELVYGDGFRARWKMGDPEAMSMMLLEHHYRNEDRQGYQAAVLDATNQVPGGLIFVLMQLAETIRMKERQEYVNGVFTRRIDPSNWYLRCEIVEVLREQYQRLLPPGLLNCDVWQLADEIPALIHRIISSLSVLGNRVATL